MIHQDKVSLWEEIFAKNDLQDFILFVKPVSTDITIALRITYLIFVEHGIKYMFTLKL